MILTLKKYVGIFKGVKLPWILILLGVTSFLLQMNAELRVATLTSTIIDASQNAINSAELMRYIGVVALAGIVTVSTSYFTRKMEEVITLRLRLKLWDIIMRLPMKFYDVDNGDTLVSRITSDAATPTGIFTLAISCIVCVNTTVKAFIQLFAYNTTLACYSLLIIPITLAISGFYGFMNYRIGMKQASSLAGSLGYLSERVRDFRLIKSAMTEQIEAEKGNKTFKEMYKADLANWLMIAGVQLGNSLFNIVFIVIVFVVGGKFVRSGQMSIGDITGFFMITGIAGIQLMQFFINVGSVASTFGATKKIAEIMDMEVEKQEGEKVTTSSDIVFENVTFGYQEGQEVIKNVSFRIPKGKVTAIIGGNGAGKSTLFKLITRMYKPQQGKIMLGDKNIELFELEDWRNQFSYVVQKNPLIQGTIRDNITYGLQRDVSEEELVDVSKKANCYDFVMKKTDGFDCDVGLGGSNLSGGQCQFISIARAMLRNTNYLLLDEATSNLDVVSEALVRDSMNNLMKDKTTIMIAHNYAATINADYIIVMCNGTVEATGTPEQLLENNDYYRTFRNTI